MDLFGRRPGAGQPDVMVDKINDHGHIFGHVGEFEPFSFRQFRRLIGEIGSHELVKIALLVRLIKDIESVCEQTEGSAEEDSLGMHFLFELAVNMILSPVIVRLIQLGTKAKIKSV